MKKDSFPTVAIIGGGASGLAAAVFADDEAKKNRKKVNTVVYEANSRIGKKLLVTGNGRCNFTNSDMNMCHFHGDVELVKNALSAFSEKNTVDFFRRGGVFEKTDNAGRVYPLSNQASSILDFFRFETERRDITVRTDYRVSSITKAGDGFIINGRDYADSVIFACGGKAAAVHGSDGSVFDILRSLGISHTELYPALVPLCVADFTKALKGIRADGKIIAKQNGTVIASDRGELQYTDYGISGIPAMQISGRIAPYFDSGKPVFIIVDSAPSIDDEKLKSFIIDSITGSPDKPVEMLLSGLMPKRLAVCLLSGLSFNPEKTLRTVNPSAADKIVSAVKYKKYKLSGVKGFADAQVTAGGVPLSELNPLTLEAKRVKKVFVCGETVNVDGDCGGYNLQWAWSSADVAARAAVRELINAQNK